MNKTILTTTCLLLMLTVSPTAAADEVEAQDGAPCQAPVDIDCEFTTGGVSEHCNVYVAFQRQFCT